MAAYSVLFWSKVPFFLQTQADFFVIKVLFLYFSFSKSRDVPNVPAVHSNGLFPTLTFMLQEEWHKGCNRRRHAEGWEFGSRPRHMERI